MIELLEACVSTLLASRNKSVIFHVCKINVKDSQADSVDAHQVHLELMWANINIELRGTTGPGPV